MRPAPSMATAVKVFAPQFSGTCAAVYVPAPKTAVTPLTLTLVRPLPVPGSVVRPLTLMSDWTVIEADEGDVIEMVGSWRSTLKFGLSIAAAELPATSEQASDVVWIVMPSPDETCV